MSTHNKQFGMNQTNINRLFKGPEAYQESDKKIFQGREAETQQLLYMIEHNDWCVCYARSGEGKSSLINAGLIPALRKKRMLPIVIRFEDETDKRHLKNVDFDDFVWNEIKAIKNLTIIDNLAVGPDQAILDKLWWKLRANDFRVMTEDSIYKPVIPVLIFDQFEEVFTKPQNLQWTYNFFKWLEELFRDEIPVNKDNNSNQDLIEHYFPKKFKALFSLRNEYVSELDYWSMERFFIPSLKNNRYYLKPLTIAAAKEVTKQLTNWPRGIDEDDVITAATDDKYKFFEENEEGKAGNHPQGPPCVSALILSLVLSKLEESDDYVRQKLIKMEGKEHSIDNQKEFIENLFDHIYEETLLHCGVGLKSLLRDRLEEELIDDNGRRRRPRIIDLKKVKDLAKVIKQLEKERIVCVNNGEVELSHDSISATVARHRTQRITQLKEQWETAFIVPTLILCFLASMFGLMAIFDETTSLYLEKKYAQIALWAVNAINVLFIPLFIVACVKRVKNARWLSFCFICNISLLLLLWKNGSWPATNIFIIVTTFLSFVLSIYAWYNNKSFISPIFKNTIKNVPYLIYLFFILLYTFIECVFGDFYSVSPTPYCSSWGIIVLPPLGCFITTQMLTSDGFVDGSNLKLLNRLKTYLPYVIYLSILCLIASDTAFINHRILPFFLIILVISVLLYYIWFDFKQFSARKRIIASVFNFIFFLGLLIANLGYNPLKITYNSAKIVYNWSLVYTLADNGKWGVVDAIDGDTIIPCVMDSEDFSVGSGYCDVKVDSFIASIGKVNSNLSPKEKTIDSVMMIINNQSPDGSYRYDCDNHVLVGRFWVYPKLENLLRSKENIKVRQDTSLDLKISFYSAKVYKELRKANLQYLLSGKPYTLNDIPSFSKLDSLQFCNYQSVLESTLGPSGDGNLTDTEFHQINRSLARMFLLCAIKDKINHQDLKSSFLMKTLYSYLYFAEDASWQMNYDGQFVLSPDGVTQTNFHISGVDFKDKAYSYYYMYLQVVSMEVYASFSSFANMIQLQAKIDDSLNELFREEDLNEAKELSMRRYAMDASQLFANFNTNKADNEDFEKSLLQGVEKIKGYYKEQHKWKKDISQYAKQTKKRVDQLLDDMNRLHVGYKTDDSFKRINEKTSAVIISYIERCPMSPYNIGFVRILQALYYVGFYRGYDMTVDVAKVGALVEKNKDLSYQLMNNYEEVDNMMKESKEDLETISRLLQEIIDAGQKPKSKL